ncbi:serine/threonine-protein kinase BIK1-like [Gastrolobium bilobum]|uniref:serine/threonine-protein kinase BIK1-like n=1 Tax=Gastrolobium bilobum TaxID=150636 RepID=UPI002AB2529F|nr:serine/threonine-protein kinase BIK1-like [Gastrolobium bilobum]
MDSTNLAEFSSQNLKACTNDFNESNLIGLTQFGRFFRGNLGGQYVIVKIWDSEKLECLSSKYNDEYLIIREEIKFWTNPKLKGYPKLVTLIGYSWERDIKGVVYDLNPLDTLGSVIMKDSLNWLQRIKVIHELAKILKFIHDQEKQNMVLNISASHILLDEDCRPKLFDLLLLSELKMPKEQLTMSTSHIDPYFSLRGGEWDKSSEVFSFGIVLLELVTKRISDIVKTENDTLNLDNLIHIWAKKEYKPNCSFVHKNLQEDWHYCAEDGVTITLLAMQCIEFFPSNRPTMKDVLQSLDNLSVLQHLHDARPTKREKNFVLS